MIDALTSGQFGYHQSLHQKEKGIVCNVDQSMAAFVNGQTILELIEKLYSRNTSQLDRKAMEHLEGLIIGLQFRAIHLNQIFTINGLSGESIRNTMITPRSKISVYQHFHTTHPTFYPQLNPNLPAVQIEDRDKVPYFPVEACQLLADQVYRKPTPELRSKSFQQVSSDC